MRRFFMLWISKNLTKTNPINTLYPYALSKYMGEQIVLHWGNVYGLKTNSIRIFNLCTRSRTSGAYGAVFGVFKTANEKKPLTVVGNGNKKRFSLCNLCCKCFLQSLCYKKPMFGILCGNPQSINYLIKLLGRPKLVYLPKSQVNLK